MPVAKKAEAINYKSETLSCEVSNCKRRPNRISEKLRQETIPIILKKGKSILTMKSLCDCETFGYE